MVQEFGPGGCVYNSQCSDAMTCLAASILFKCCRYLEACWTEGNALIGRKDQTIDATTPKDAITRMQRQPKIGFIVIGDSEHFKAGEMIVAINGLPAHDTASWDAWLKSDVATFTVLDSQSHRPTARTITRL